MPQTTRIFLVHVRFLLMNRDVESKEHTPVSVVTIKEIDVKIIVSNWKSPNALIIRSVKSLGTEIYVFYRCIQCKVRLFSGVFIALYMFSFLGSFMMVRGVLAPILAKGIVYRLNFNFNLYGACKGVNLLTQLLLLLIIVVIFLYIWMCMCLYVCIYYESCFSTSLWCNNVNGR